MLFGGHSYQLDVISVWQSEFTWVGGLHHGTTGLRIPEANEETPWALMQKWAHSLN